MEGPLEDRTDKIYGLKTISITWEYKNTIFSKERLIEYKVT